MITPEDVLRSNRRIMWYTLIVTTCTFVVGGAGFLLLLILERKFNPLSTLVEEKPRVALIMFVTLILLCFIGISIIALILRRVFLISRATRRKHKKYRKELRQARRIARKHGQKFNLEEFRVRFEERYLDENEGVTRVLKGEDDGEPSPVYAAAVASPSTSKGDAASDSAGPKVAHRFPTLSDFDEAHPSFEEVVPDPSLTLRGLVEGFRDYAASAKGLYYSRADVRAVLCSRSCSHTMILQGMSGTGKTSLPVAVGEWLASPTEVIPVQPTWKERSDILGYYNEFTGAYSESQLLKSLYAAGGTDAVRIIVLDEANIARVEYYFAEFLSLLELPDPSRRRVSAAPSAMPGDPRRMEGGSILLPENVWFILTANNDDSTFAFSDKVYDRASVIDLDTRAEPFDAPATPGVRCSAPALQALFEEARRRYAVTPRDLRKIAELDKALRSLFGISFGNRVMLQIRNFVPAYVASGGSSSEALDQLLSRKVLRKLAAANPVVVRSKAPELLTLLKSLFGEGGAPLCEAAIRRIADI